MDDRLSELGRRLRESRLAAGMTQLDLAVVANVCDSLVSKVETGHQVPSLLVLLCLSDALGVEVGWLLAREGANDRREACADAPHLG